VKIVTILGARPQFIKSWSVSHALRNAGAAEVLVHTGQHYDPSLSGRFFAELGLAEPAYNLEVGSGPQGQQTGRILEAAERVLLAERPDWVLVYGDTNSTLGGALAAAKLHLRLAHIEAGLRSFNRRMPEEINRVLTDHVSARLFCPSAAAAHNLAREGIAEGVEIVGDVMHASLQHFVAQARTSSTVLDRLGLAPQQYHAATLHRAELTGDPERLRAVLEVLDALELPVVLPLHPRTNATLERTGGRPRLRGGLRLVEPLGYLDFLRLVEGACRVLTDSGGLQKEAYWLGRPCVTLRSETEWTETVAAGWNTLVGTDPQQIRAALAAPPPALHPELYGDAHAAERIVATLVKCV